MIHASQNNMNKRKSFPLSIKQFNILHLEQGLSISEISRQHNIDVAWISTWARRNNVQIITKSTQSAGLTKEALEQDCKSGLSTRDMATKYSVSKSLIGQKLKKFELKTKPVPHAAVVVVREKDETSIQISNLIKQKWSDNKYKTKITTTMQSEEYKNKMSESVSKQWVSEDFRIGMNKFRSLQQGQITAPHKKVVEILKNLNIEYKIEHIIGPWKFDIFIPSHNLLIEVQGTYWHNLKGRPQRDKAKATYIISNFPQYQLKYVLEHECLVENKILENIKYWLGINKIYTDYNMSEIVVNTPPIDMSDKFLYNWHYIHHGRHGIDFGGYLNSELIVLARFTSPSRQEISTSLGYEFNEVLELSRFCIHPKYQKKNLASWFLAKCEQNIKNNYINVKCLVSFADTSYDHVGTIYKASNWKLHSVVPPNYHYVDKDGWIMHKKTLWNHAKKMSTSERDFAKEYGYMKVWGKEKLKFIKKL